MQIKEGLRPMGQASAGAVAKDGGQSNLKTGQHTSSCVKNQTEEVTMHNDQPLVKGGCGHSAEELEFSAVVCGVCAAVFILVLVVGIGIKLFA